MSHRYAGSKGMETARAALIEMERRSIPPTPQNYFLWASYLTGDVPGLIVDMEKVLSSSRPFNDGVSDQLFEKHFNHISDGEMVIEAGGRMAASLAEVVNTLASAGRDTRAYGATLEGVSGQLSAADSTSELKTMVDELCAATERMSRQNATLEERLEQTTSEVDHLRSDLERIRTEAKTDPLTGVANRRQFDEAIAGELTRCRAEGAPLSLVLADIDHFKKFNDTWGHQTGDQIIRFVARTMSSHAEPNHVVARYGGEEFAIVMPDTPQSAAAATAERVREAVAAKLLKRRSTEDVLGHVTISLGVAILREDDDSQSLVERADKLLYQSKQQGRNRTSTDCEDDGGAFAEDAAA